MATLTIAGKTVQVNDEGFLTNPAEWTKEIGAEIAKQEGIAELSEAQWKVIDWARGAAQGGKSPTLRQITTGVNITTKDLFTLFPKRAGQKSGAHRGFGQTRGMRLI